jgi:hypothetical protein
MEVAVGVQERQDIVEFGIHRVHELSLTVKHSDEEFVVTIVFDYVLRLCV